MKQNKMLVMFAGLFFLLLLANSANSQTSPFSGKYQGTFTLKVPILLISVDDGTWDITVGSNGNITGFHYSKTTGDKTTFEGSIDEKGRITIFFGDEGTIIKGLLKKTEKYLSGSLGMSCDFGRKQKVCADIEVRLKRIELSVYAKI